MRQSRHLKWNYFPENSAQLLDKIYKFEDTTFELGGMAAINILQIKKNTIAVHTTCYEQKSKVMGLKVSFSWFDTIVTPLHLFLCWSIFQIFYDLFYHIFTSSFPPNFI